MKISNENLNEIENDILSIQDELYEYYSDEALYTVMELTKSKKVFLKCMENVYIPYLVEKVKDPNTSTEMILKLTAHPKGMIQLPILERQDTSTNTLKLLIENFKGILEYEDFFARISTHIGNININGFNLKLSQMTEDDILVSGKIENLDCVSFGPNNYDIHTPKERLSISSTEKVWKLLVEFLKRCK